MMELDRRRPLLYDLIAYTPNTIGEEESRALSDEIRDVDAWRCYSGEHHADIQAWIEIYLKEFAGLYVDIGLTSVPAQRVNKPLFVYNYPIRQGQRKKGLVYGNGAIETLLRLGEQQELLIDDIAFFVNNNEAVRYGLPQEKFWFNNQWFESYGA